MKICDKESLAVCLLDSVNKDEAIVEVVERCSIFSTVANRSSFIRHVMARERLQSTGIGHGIAIAHGTVKVLDHVHIGLGISCPGIAYESFDHLPVHLLFVIASSSALQGEYVASLGSILRALQSEEVRSLLVDLRHQCGEQPVQEFLSMMESQDFAPHSHQ